MRTASLVFDLDGTLSDPAVGILRSLNHALEAFGLPGVTAATLSASIGPPLDEAFAALVPDARPDTIVALVGKYRERYARIGYSENTLYPGIASALEQLSFARVRMGVCTSKRVDFAERILEMFDLRRYFTFVSGGDIGVAKRDQLRDLLGRGAITRGATMIGDRAVDMQAARATGLRAVAALWGHGTREELMSTMPDQVLEAPSELTRFIPDGAPTRGDRTSRLTT